MKPDGDTMETPEPTEAAAVAEPSLSQDNITEQAPSQPEEAANDTAPTAAPKDNGKPVAADPKVKPKAAATKIQPPAKSAGAFGSRPGTASHRTANDVKSSNNVSVAAVRQTATAAKASAAGAVPKRPVGAAAASTMVKNQSRVPDKKPVGPARTTSVAAATATNSTKSTTVNGIPKKRPVAETVNVARPKTTATASRAAASTAPKPSTSTTTKAGGAAISKTTTRPATGPSTSRPASTTSRLASATSRPTTSTVKPSTTATAKTAASRVTTAPSTGRTTAAQPPKTVAAKKDVSRPPSAAVAKKPTAATTSAATKKPEPSRPAATVKLNSASKWSTTAKAADPKVPQSKTLQPAKSTPKKKPVAAVRSIANNKQLLGRTPPASPANKPINSSTPQAKHRTKPTQAVPPFTAAKKTGASNSTTPAVEAVGAAGAVVVVAAATAAAVLADSQTEASTESFPQGSSLAASAPEEVPPPVLAQDTKPDVIPQETAAASSPPQSPVRTALPQTSPPQEQLESSAPLLTTQEQTPAPAEPTFPPVACPPDLSEDPVYLLTDQTPSTSKALPAAANAIPLTVPPTNLNEEEEEDEEEREGSQLVSVSEMSGTTQPTEESRPGSAGPVGGSAWRASGALLSELDSEDVSGSQQGASELSAPGVLEGTESMDDLGDGSLKGAIDMEGASAGSPDFEKVPDIPVNDFDEDEDEDDDDDRVCDMDVGSERADEPQKPRHDNDVDDEEEEEEEEDDDEDVEMASEGVTESGLESYGNADEDDFAEDERLDNLNRVVEPPPPPPLLPSAPAAQWDQPNPFADPWAEPLQPEQVLEHVSQPALVAEAAAASPVADTWQADSETPTQTPAQAWLELGSAAFVPEDVLQHSSVKNEPQNLEAQMYMDQSSPAPMQTPLAPALLSAPGMSLSSTLSSETSTPEELCAYNRDGNLQPQDMQMPVLSPQLDLDREGEEDAEAETLPADEVLGGPATAPTSNPSSASVTEDEASDTEGEAQLDDSLEGPLVRNITFESQPPALRSLSTVEEGEEADGGAGEDTTPPSATSLASYGFDTMTTASNSNAQSTGESCIKSPGIFSLEELSEEAKEPCLIPQPHTQQCLAEQQYIECGKQEAESAEHLRDEVPGPEQAPDPSSTLSTLQPREENPDDIQPPYYSAICEKTENSFAGFTALPHPHRRDHSAYPRTYCDLVKPLTAAAAPPRLTCADLPPRSLGQQALSPQLRRLEQHQRQLLEMQQRRDQQSRPLEEAEQERKTREEEEQRKKKEEAEEEIKRNKEELERKTREQAEVTKKEEDKSRKEEEIQQRRDLELQLQHQQQELKERQQIMQWQQELQQSNKGQTVLLSPSSGLCTIYEALENSDEEEEGKKELNLAKEKTRQETNEETDDCERTTSDKDEHQDSSPSTESPPPLRDSPQTSSNPSQDGDSSSPLLTESPERPPPLDLDWGKKVDIVQQLINQTLLLNRDGCSSLLLLPGGAGGTLSPLESSLWPSLLPPLTPPSATVTSVSSFSPEATGSSPQGEWTVVELETHH